MLDGVVIDDTETFNDKLQEWEDFDNFNRPHVKPTHNPARNETMSRDNCHRCPETSQVVAGAGLEPATSGS